VSALHLKSSDAAPTKPGNGRRGIAIGKIAPNLELALHVNERGKPFWLHRCNQVGNTDKRSTRERTGDRG